MRFKIQKILKKWKLGIVMAVTELPGYTKKSFAMPFGGGEI